MLKPRRLLSLQRYGKKLRAESRKNDPMFSYSSKRQGFGGCEASLSTPMKGNNQAMDWPTIRGTIGENPNEPIGTSIETQILGTTINECQNQNKPRIQRTKTGRNSTSELGSRKKSNATGKTENNGWTTLEGKEEKKGVARKRRRERSVRGQLKSYFRGGGGGGGGE